jgi:hypothetical protein
MVWKKRRTTQTNQNQTNATKMCCERPYSETDSRLFLTTTLHHLSNIIIVDEINILLRSGFTTSSINNVAPETGSLLFRMLALHHLLILSSSTKILPQSVLRVAEN